MLKVLKISNYALIESAEIEFGSQMNVITGETGAGKSILLGALNLILGARADTSVLLNKEKKCIVEGVFLLKPALFQKIFENYELDFDEETIIRREINKKGKSRAFINDTPVQLNTLKEITSLLIDIHSQNQTAAIGNKFFQMQILDSYCRQSDRVITFSETLKHLKALEKEKEQLIELRNSLLRDYDYYRFQVEEIDALRLEPGESETLEKELSRLENADKIKNILLGVLQELSENEISLYNHLLQIKTMLKEIQPYFSDITGHLDKIDNMEMEVREMSRDFEKLLSSLDIDEEQLSKLSERYNQINRLLAKHKVSGSDDLLSLADQYREKMQNTDNLDEKIQQLEKQIQQEKTRLQQLADKLSEERKKHLPPLLHRLKELLREVGISNPRLEYQLEKTDTFRSDGQDLLTLLFSPNPGIEVQPIEKAASGGELSRIMLCLKYILAENSELATLVFDEIDMGISGEIALRVGKLLSQMSRNHQIIAITHLAQTAALKAEHFKVYKSLKNNKTHTYITRLDSRQRLEEIASMIDGVNPGEHAYKSAKELIDKFD